MRDSADSYDPAFGRVRKTSSNRQRNRLDDEETFAKRNRHVRVFRGHLGFSFLWFEGKLRQSHDLPAQSLRCLAETAQMIACSRSTQAQNDCTYAFPGLVALLHIPAGRAMRRDGYG